MMHRIIAIGYTMFGVAATLFWFIVIPHLSFWNPSRYTLGIVIICVAMINISGLVYLIRKRADSGRWLIATGLIGNGVSLFVIVYALAGCLFLEYVFRM
jgi:hypothetical protein